MNFFESIKQMIDLTEQLKTQVKGTVGEIGTAEIIKWYFNYNNIKYKIVKNVYLKFSNNKTTEIDIIVISEYGVFVIENKNYSGWIFGNLKDEQWTETFPNGSKFKFYNPLKQNYTHINTLKNYINEKYHNIIYSYIVFSGECELKKVPYNSEFIKIIKSNQIFDTLSENLKNKYITFEEIETLYNNLNQYAHASKEEKQQHNENIKSKSL